MTFHQPYIEHSETGHGETILFVPGSFSTPAAWRGIHANMQTQYRCVSTSLCGYGKTAETRNFADADMEHQLHVVRAIAERIGAPVHLVGHSFGATVALAAAIGGAVEVRSIATFEANPITLLTHLGQRELLDSALQLISELEAAHVDGDRDAARLVIDYWGGEGSFDEMPEMVKDYCRKTTYNNILDWQTVLTFKTLRGDYAKLDVPVLLVRGEFANPVMQAITSGLEVCLPNARTAVVKGASHFLISTHAQECSNLLSAFIDTVSHQNPTPVAA